MLKKLRDWTSLKKQLVKKFVEACRNDEMKRTKTGHESTPVNIIDSELLLLPIPVEEKPITADEVSRFQKMEEYLLKEHAIG